MPRRGTVPAAAVARRARRARYSRVASGELRGRTTARPRAGRSEPQCGAGTRRGFPLLTTHGQGVARRRRSRHRGGPAARRGTATTRERPPRPGAAVRRVARRSPPRSTLLPTAACFSKGTCVATASAAGSTRCRPLRCAEIPIDVVDQISGRRIRVPTAASGGCRMPAVPLGCTSSCPISSPRRTSPKPQSISGQNCAREGTFIASIRDYEEILQQRPVVQGPALYSETGKRRIVFQLWGWQDERRYTFRRLSEPPLGAAEDQRNGAKNRCVCWGALAGWKLA